MVGFLWMPCTELEKVGILRTRIPQILALPTTSPPYTLYTSDSHQKGLFLRIYTLNRLQKGEIGEADSPSEKVEEHLKKKLKCWLFLQLKWGKSFWDQCTKRYLLNTNTSPLANFLAELKKNKLLLAYTMVGRRVNKIWMKYK